MSYKEKKDLLTGKSLRHQLNKRFSVKYPRKKSYLFRIRKGYSPVMRPELEDEDVLREYPKNKVNAPVVQRPMQFSKSNNFSDTKLIGREIADYALPLLEGIEVSIVSAGYRQVLRGDEVHSIKAFQIIDFNGNITEKEAKNITNVCDESWRI